MDDSLMKYSFLVRGAKSGMGYFWWGSKPLLAQSPKVALARRKASSLFTSPDYFTDYVPNMMKVTKADMTNYVNKYIKNNPYVAGMIISPEMNKQLNPGEYFKGKDF